MSARARTMRWSTSSRLILPCGTVRCVEGERVVRMQAGRREERRRRFQHAGAGAQRRRAPPRAACTAQHAQRSTPAHVVNDVVQAVAHRARQQVNLARAAVGAVEAHALDDAGQEAVGVADAPGEDAAREQR